MAVVKNIEKHEEAHELFRDSPINITVEGKRHLGAAIGSSQFKEEYINEKVNKWASNIETLSEIAKSEPMLPTLLIYTVSNINTTTSRGHYTTSTSTLNHSTMQLLSDSFHLCLGE